MSGAYLICVKVRDKETKELREEFNYRYADDLAQACRAAKRAYSGVDIFGKIYVIPKEHVTELEG
jgi:hypothetical protein